jgi:dethiobiotin synthetase
VSVSSDPPTLLVVTGTGTEVGKTIVTAAVAALASAAGRTVAVLKAAQTGLGPGEPGDVHEVGRLSGVTDLHELARYPEPLAPATAARRSGMRQVRVVDVVKYAQGLSSRDLVLVEGAGGALVHLDKAGGTLLDVAARLNAPMLLVSSAGLGSLNLLALNAEAFAARGVTCLGVVIGSWPREPDLASRTNLADFEAYAKLPLMGVIPEGASQLSRRIFLSVARSGLAPVLGGTFDAAAFRTKVGADATQVTRRTRAK